jgi:hypothetical protein
MRTAVLVVGLAACSGAARPSPMLAGTPPPAAPVVAAGPGAIDAEAYCAARLATLTQALSAQTQAQEAACAADFANCEQGDATPTERPRCTFEEVPVGGLAPPWLAVGVATVTHDSFEGAACQVAVRTAAGWWRLGDEHDCGEFTIHDRMRDLTVTTAALRDGALEVRYHTHAQGFDTTDPDEDHELISTCTSADGAVDCNAEIEVAPDLAPEAAP